MVRMRRWSGTVVVVAGLVVSCARQAVPEYPPLASSARQASTGEVPVRILELHAEFKFDEKGNWEQRSTQKYRILTREGVESWGSTGATWSPWYMARPEIHAQVQDPGGALRELDPNVIAEASASPDLPDSYGDGRTLRAPLPGVQVGSIVTESMVRKTTRPFFVGGASFQVNFQTAIPRDKVELVIDLPEKTPFQYDVRDLKVVHSETVKGGRRRVVFRGENYGAVEPVDDYTPSNVAAWPSVIFSTGESWQKIASAYEALMEEKLKGAAGVAELARRSVKPGASPLEQANQLLFALHERVRYAAVEFGQAAIVPSTPAETLKRTFGDCKDQSLVLVAMLRAVGLPATLALLRAGPGEDVHPRMPGLDAFDHAIVVVRGEHPFWIDPTSDYARAGELPVGDQGRLALIIDDDTTALSPIPTMSASQNTYLETREISLREAGPARIVEVSTSSGVLEQRTRGSFSSSEQERTKGLVEYVKRFYDADKLVSSKFEGFEDTRQQARLSLEASSESFGASDLFVASVPVDQSLVYSYLPDALTERDPEHPRKGDLLLPVRYRAEVRYRIVPPPHFKAKQLPKAPPIDMGPAKLLRQYRVAADGSVEAVFKLEIDKRQLTPADQAAIWAGFDAIGQEPRDTVELEHEAVLAFETGQPVQGMKVMREQAQAEPKSVAPLLRWAFKLNELGFGRQAREKVRAAMALDPNSNLVQRSAGFVFTRDEHGRWLMPGHDRQSAIAAQRRAAELDPEDVFAKTELAVLLEHDDKGKRYANADGVEEAIRIYDSIPDEALKNYENGDFRWNALYALLNVERFKELRERLSKLKSEDLPPHIPITLEALEGGAAAALALADQRQLRGEPRAQALATAASTAYQKRLYPTAAALFEEAAKSSSSDASKYSSLSRVLRKTVRVEAQQAKHDSPEAVVRKSVLLVMASDDFSGGSALKALLSSRAAQDKAKRVPQAEALMAASTVDRASGMPRAVLVDTGASMMKVSSEGDDATGYRVKVTTTGLDGRASLASYYVVKEGAEYRIRAVDDRGALGCEALYLQQKHADKAAKKWLGWAAEDAGEGFGDDPLRALPFVRLWSDGKGNAELAATALCASSAGGKDARQALLKRRVKGAPDASLIEHAIADSAGFDGDPEQQLRAAEELLRLHPGSTRARQYQLWALRRLNRPEQYERAVRAAESDPKTARTKGTGLLLDLADVQAHDGKVAESRKTLQRVIDDGESFERALAYNNSAWNGLFLPKRPKEMLDHALRAVELASGDRYSAVHTLACVYLDQGNVAEAQRQFDKLLELDKLPALSDATRYVLGGLAAAYGMPEEARRAYQSVAAPKQPYPTSTYALAQRQLRALDQSSTKK
jgi:transglutaminase-like putative cysteine protease/tetratricopeptide (TPR) repeat protein